MLRMALSLLLWLIFSQASAWSMTGHHVIAAISYDHLTPQAKKMVNRYSKTFSSSRRTKYRFMIMSAWPDRIKLQGIELYNRWHFMPYPDLHDGITSEPAPKKSLVWAVRYNKEQWRRQRSDRQRAKALAFIAHLVGDAHQPMHCIERFDKRFPYGDKGGLKWLIKSPKGRNLHEYWDNGAGLLKISKRSYKHYLKQVYALAKSIQKEYPWSALSKQMKQQDSSLWARHSFSIAKQYAYDLPYKGRPSKSYQVRAQQQSRKQLALAGYRLAYWLNNYGVKFDESRSKSSS